MLFRPKEKKEMEAIKKTEKGVDDDGDDPAEKKEKMMMVVAILVKKENAAHPGERKGKKNREEGRTENEISNLWPFFLIIFKRS